jgi:DNA-binding NarL/FixJ family response regulator
MLTRIPGRLAVVSRSPASREHPLAPRSVSEQPSFDISSVHVKLTPRQRDVLAVMMQGKSNKAICRALNLAEPTVKNHVTAILKALNVTNRTEAVIKATRASVTALSYNCTVAGYSTFKQT